MRSWIKYVAAIAGGTAIGTAYFVPSGAFMAFLTFWLLLIPAASAVFLVYGLSKYMEDRKNSITVSVKPSEAMKVLARREAELQKEKELLLKELYNGVKRS